MESIVHRCPHCSKPIVIGVHLQAMNSYEDETRALLSSWLGIASWGEMQIRFMEERIAKHGYETVSKAVAACIKAHVKNWNYLDKILGTNAAPSRGGLEDDLFTDFAAEPKSVPASTIKSQDKREVRDMIEETRELF